MLDQQTIVPQTEPDIALQQALAAFNQPPIQAEVRPQLLSPTEQSTEEAEPITQEESPVEAEEQTEESIEPSAFAEQFKEAFGVDLGEAKETLNRLQAFQEEQQLMRHWQLNPTDYDQRITQVRDFYSTLPDEGKDQFNSVEGAIAIWDHLQKQNPSNATKPKATSKSNSRIRQPEVAKPKVYSKREIVKMPKAEYDRLLPEINKAFREGRVVE